MGDRSKWREGRREPKERSKKRVQSPTKMTLENRAAKRYKSNIKGAEHVLGWKQRKKSTLQEVDMEIKKKV